MTVASAPLSERFWVELSSGLAPPVENLIWAGSWETWLREAFGPWFADSLGRPIPFAEHHRTFWRWVWTIRRGERQDHLLAIWPRDGGKSTNAEIAAVAVAARRVRRYALYISATQDQADDHVSNIENLLASPALDYLAPEVTQRSLNKYGHSKGWRRNRLRTASGFTIDALGLNTGARGIKLDMARPDLVILDDLDDEIDTVATVRKKIKILTRKILPAGSRDLIVLAIQNLVHSEGVFSRLLDGRETFLARRQVSGPHPALLGAKFAQVDGRAILQEGTPTWEGLDLARCQEIVDDIGMEAFLKEHQHDVAGRREGALWDREEMINPFRVSQEPKELDQVVVAVDPAVTAKRDSDETGVVVIGRKGGQAYVLQDLSGRYKPAEWAKIVISAYHKWTADRVIGEVNNGGDLVENTLRMIDRNVSYKSVVASRGKVLRAEPVVALYEEGRIHHVGVLDDLESQMTSWIPNEGASPDRVDALVWGVTEALLGARHHGIHL